MKKMFLLLLLLPSLGACSVDDGYYVNNPYPDAPNVIPEPEVRNHGHAVPPPVIDHRHNIPRNHGPVVVKRSTVHRHNVNPNSPPTVANETTNNHSHGHD